MANDWRDIAHATLVDGLRGPIGRQAGAVIDERDGLLIARGRIEHHWYNVVIRTSSELDADETMERAERAFSPERRSYFVFARDWVDSDLIDAAQHYGLTVEDSYPYMVAKGEPRPVQLPAGVNVVYEPSEQLAQDFGGVALLFAEHPSGAIAIRDAMRAEEMFANNNRYWVAYVNGEPVATAAVELGPNAPGIYWVATTPAFRGKGIATALVTIAWQWALSQGANAVSLQPSKEGHNLYKRMGFWDEGSFTRLIKNGPIVGTSTT